MELIYTKVGDYYIPDLVLGDQPGRPLGRYGRMRQKFLEEHHPGTYNQLMLFGKLCTHLADTDAACQERLDTLNPAMAKREGVTEKEKIMTASRRRDDDFSLPASNSRRRRRLKRGLGADSHQ